VHFGTDISVVGPWRRLFSFQQYFLTASDPERNMRIYQIDPTKDARWAEFVLRHPHASIFHTVGWLEALRNTYGYEPVVFTTSSSSTELGNGLLFCRVDSWLTGCRLVSLPFSDHCEPLCDSMDDMNFLVCYLLTSMEHQDLRYLEIRPIDRNFGQTSETNGFQPAGVYFLHVLDLRPELDQVFGSLDKDSVQRRVQRAERASLAEKCGRSDDLLKEFFALFVKTRGRHRLPPTPYIWFRNLIRSYGEALEIRIAYWTDTPISAILTLRCKDMVYYKYGCSDARFNRFGAIPWLLWRAIATAKCNGASQFDMGRTEEHNAGLLAFKNHWVSQPQRVVYWRFPRTAALESVNSWKLRTAKRVFSFMPDGLRTIAGKLLYRHIG
jgi:hypothetical protein